MSNITEDFHLTLPFAVFLTISNCFSSLVGTVGNILVLIIILKSKTLNRTTDYLIMALASADVLVTSIMQPMFTYHIHYYTETDGTTFDVFLDITGYVSNIASIAFMLVVTIDRFVSICYPLKYKTILFKKRIFVIIGVVWVFSALFGILFRLNSLPTGLVWGLSFLLLMGTLSAYPYIFYVARKQEKMALRMLAQARGSSNEFTHAKAPGKATRFRIFTENKSTKTVAMVVGVFAICWLPILVYTLVKMDKRSNKQEFLPGFFVVYTMSMLNSACNPFIYCVRNQRYRVIIKKMFQRSRSVANKTTGLDNHGVSKS